MGLFGGGTQTTTSTTGVDPASQQYIDWQRQMAQQAAGMVTGEGANPGQYFTGPTSGQRGALASIPGGGLDIGAFSNPYEDQVVAATRGEFDHLRDQATMGTAQQATLGGAFGGSRHAVLQGARMGELDRGQASTIADIRDRGYQSATQAALAHRSGLLNESMARFGGENVFQALDQQKAMAPVWGAQQGLNFSGQGLGPTGMTSVTTEPKPSQWGNIFGAAQVGMGLWDKYSNRNNPDTNGQRGYRSLPPGQEAPTFGGWG